MQSECHIVFLKLDNFAEKRFSSGTTRIRLCQRLQFINKRVDSLTEKHQIQTLKTYLVERLYLIAHTFILEIYSRQTIPEHVSYYSSKSNFSPLFNEPLNVNIMKTSINNAPSQLEMCCALFQWCIQFSISGSAKKTGMLMVVNTGVYLRCYYIEIIKVLTSVITM